MESIQQPITKQLLTLPEVKAFTGLSTTTIYKYASLGKFPKPKKIGNMTRWRLADIQDFINQD